MMETTAIFNVSLVGEESGQPFNGQFKVKTLLTRRDRLRADEIRRELIGGKPEGASPSAAADAMVLSQLAVRIIESPQWWKDAGGGLDMADDNVLAEIFKIAIDEASKRAEALQKESEEALKKLAK
jgi:hypothetical protein